MRKEQIQVRECSELSELEQCVQLQREIFAMPEIELSPLRHFVVTKNAGGFILGAFQEDRLIGFCLSVPAMLHGQKAFYSHMTGVVKDFQGRGIGARLKWAQRKRSLELDVKFIKWTFQPVMAKNAYFNLEKLGAVVREYLPNFYGTDYSTAGERESNFGLDSDRLFAEWYLESEKVAFLAKGNKYIEEKPVISSVYAISDWNLLRSQSREKAAEAQLNLKKQFEREINAGFKCRGFERQSDGSKYLFYAD